MDAVELQTGLEAKFNSAGCLSPAATYQRPENSRCDVVIAVPKRHTLTLSEGVQVGVDEASRVRVAVIVRPDLPATLDHHRVVDQGHRAVIDVLGHAVGGVGGEGMAGSDALDAAC